MPGGMFLPIFGMIASFAISSLLAPKVPKPPSVAPTPPAPKVAPVPVAPKPPEPAQEPTVKPEDATAAQQEQQRAIKRRATDATAKPLDIISDDSTVNYKTLLGE